MLILFSYPPKRRAKDCRSCESSYGHGRISEPCLFNWLQNEVKGGEFGILLLPELTKYLQDDSNSHFTLFEFRKMARKPKSEKGWSKVLSRAGVLKPCEYKRR